jgi:endonuclease I
MNLLLSQPFHTDVFKGVTGSELFENVVDDFKPAFNLSYGEARDTLYSLIDILPGNKLECVYSGYQITLNLNLDPTIDAFDKGINAEHTYPQSKGAGDGLGRSDMHHLQPSRVNVNSDRGSHPYGESPDTKTDFWYEGTNKLSNIPNSNINIYSELDSEGENSIFEPRESVKGNVARGIMYFYTMYRQEAMDADPDFFDIQKEDLCDWHFQDPVDEREWNRTNHIALYQDDKPNPFVLDCSLASRIYCDQISDACNLLVKSEDLTLIPTVTVSAPYPNPLSSDQDVIAINISDIESQQLLMSIYDVLGKVISAKKVLTKGQLSARYEISVPQKPGVYFILITDLEGNSIMKKFIRL